MKQQQREQERIFKIVATRTTMIDMEANQIAQKAEYEMQEIVQKSREEKAPLLYEAALSAGREAKERARTGRAVAEQARQTLRGPKTEKPSSRAVFV
eukprot:1065835-Pyramimonas_sp.AAC.1